VTVGIIAFALMAQDISWSWIGWIGVVPLVTGLASRCPAYSIFGISSCSMDDKRTA